MASAKVDNARAAEAKKIELRRWALEQVQPARVMDAFCGRGRMWETVWHRAEEYLGCDERAWSASEPRGFHRLVSENVLALRSLNLSRFNIFDLDAYGEPWRQAIVIARRRRWRLGERGALVVTDGGSLKSRWGSTSRALAWLVGIPGKVPQTAVVARQLHRAALARWAGLAGVEPLRLRTFSGSGSGRGSQLQIYSAVLFEGQPTSAN